MSHTYTAHSEMGTKKWKTGTRRFVMLATMLALVVGAVISPINPMQPQAQAADPSCWHAPTATVQKNIQQALKDAKKYTGAVDGVWGSVSKAAIQTVASEYGKYGGPIDGVPGANTCKGVQQVAQWFGGYTGPLDGILGVNSWNGFLAAVKRLYSGPAPGTIAAYTLTMLHDSTHFAFTHNTENVQHDLISIMANGFTLGNDACKSEGPVKIDRRVLQLLVDTAKNYHWKISLGTILAGYGRCGGDTHRHGLAIDIKGIKDLDTGVSVTSFGTVNSTIKQFLTDLNATAKSMNTKFCVGQLNAWGLKASSYSQMTGRYVLDTPDHIHIEVPIP